MLLLAVGVVVVMVWAAIVLWTLTSVVQEVLLCPSLPDVAAAVLTGLAIAETGS